MLTYKTKSVGKCIEILAQTGQVIQYFAGMTRFSVHN